MALNIIKELKLRKTHNKVLEAQLEECKKELDEKKKHLHRAVYRANYFEGKLKELHESNLILVGQLKHQNMVMEYLHRQNADLLMQSREKSAIPPMIRVVEVRTDKSAP